MLSSCKALAPSAALTAKLSAHYPSVASLMVRSLICDVILYNLPCAPPPMVRVHYRLYSPILLYFSQNFQQVISSDAKLPTPHFCYNSTSVSRWQAHFCAVTLEQRMLNAQDLALTAALLWSHQRHSPLFPSYSLGMLTDPAASWGTYL